MRSFHNKLNIEAGCDEAGRGCLAGPVVAAAVILPTNYRSRKINDSKQVPEDLRYKLAEQIKRDAIAWSVSVVDNFKIDEINILNASILAMHHAVDGLHTAPTYLLIDGNRFKPYRQTPHLCVIKGDEKYLSIAAASILAKTHRDTLMMELHKDFEHYGWHTNKGYGTKVHREAIVKYGSCVHHRQSFTLTPQEQPELFEEEDFA